MVIYIVILLVFLIVIQNFVIIKIRVIRVYWLYRNIYKKNIVLSRGPMNSIVIDSC